MIKIQHKIADVYQVEQPADTEAELIRDYGSHSLAFFGLSPENMHFLTPDGEGLVNYRLVHNVAVVLGDPLGPPEALGDITRSFLNFCAFHHWRVAFYQASSQYLACSRTLNLHAFKMGEEAIISPQTFTLSGSAMANVRTSCRRAEREGVVVSWYEDVPPVEVMQQLEHVSRTWLESKAGKHKGEEMSFSTGRLDELTSSAEQAEMLANLSPSAKGSHAAVPRFVTAVATTPSGQVCAFVTFTPIYGFATRGATATSKQSEVQGWGWALDLMRRIPDAPPGVMELLLVHAIEHFRAYGAQRVSLGMVAMADTQQEMTPTQWQLANFVIDRLHLLDTRHTLFKFKQKFHPNWESRYLVANSTLAWPQVALAVFRLRNYSGGGLAKLITRHAQ